MREERTVDLPRKIFDHEFFPAILSMEPMPRACACTAEERIAGTGICGNVCFAPHSLCGKPLAAETAAPANSSTLHAYSGMPADDASAALFTGRPG